MLDDRQKRLMRARLRKSGLTARAAEDWIENWELRDAPLVASEVVYDPARDPKKTQTIRVGRFRIVRPLKEAA